MAQLAESKLEAIRANIYPAAHGSVEDWKGFNWHRYRGIPDTDKLQSSQALCISIWGSLGVEGIRSEVAALIGGIVGERLRAQAPFLELEVANRSLLNEVGGNPSNLDAVIRAGSLVIPVESKLGEAFDKCGQRKRRKGHESPNCSGMFDAGSDWATKSKEPCRLLASDGRRTPRRYWEVMSRVSKVPFRSGHPCWFAGRGFQVMRVIASAVELGGVDGWWALFAYPPTLSPKAKGDIESVVSLLREEHRQRVVHLNYELLAQQLLRSADAVARGLGAHVRDRLLFVAEREGLSLHL